MKKENSIFQIDQGFDKKCKLNRLNKKVPSSYLEMIEKGITLEQLDIINRRGYPIFKYKTQITIHGLFNQLETFRIAGYTNLFQNKNKSIGVKYNAIDEQKRQRIASRLKTIGINYSRNSTQSRFQREWKITKENYETILLEAKTLSAKFKDELFIGTKHLWIGDVWGTKFLVFELHINAIYEKNIEPFLNNAGATIEIFQEVEKKEKAEKLEREKYWNDKRAEKAEKQKIEKAKHSDNLKMLDSNYTRFKKTSEPGVYLEPRFNYEDVLKYQIFYIYDIPGKKKPRLSKVEFDTLNEALDHKPESTYRDDILKYPINGYKIK